MNYAIEYSKAHYSTLVVTPRKRTLKNRLIHVHSGLVLIKLKKFEYALEKDSAFWIPSDCLTSLSFLPQTEVSVIELSVRLHDVFPLKAGFVSPAPVSAAIINKLATQNCPQEHKNTLLQVVREELTQLEPELTLSAYSEMFTQWEPQQDSPLSQEIQLSLKLREARKRLLSGTRRDLVVEQLFNGAEKEFEQLSELILGQAL